MRAHYGSMLHCELLSPLIGCVTELPRGSGFNRAKFSRGDRSLVLFTSVNAGGDGYLLRWEQDVQGIITLVKRAKAHNSPITAFDISATGRFLGTGTSEGVGWPVGLARAFCHCSRAICHGQPSQVEQSIVGMCIADCQGTVSYHPDLQVMMRTRSSSLLAYQIRICVFNCKCPVMTA